MEVYVRVTDPSWSAGVGERSLDERDQGIHRLGLVIASSLSRQRHSAAGLEISSAALGPSLPQGLMIAMNSKPQNVLVFKWEDVAGAVKRGGNEVPVHTRRPES